MSDTSSRSADNLRSCGRRVVSPSTVVGFATGGVWVHCGDTNDVYATHDATLLTVLAHFTTPQDASTVSNALNRTPAVERHINELVRIGALTDAEARGGCSAEVAPGHLVATYLAPIAESLDDLASTLSAIGPDLIEDIRQKSGISIETRLRSSLSAFQSLKREIERRIPGWTKAQLEKLSLPESGLSLHLGAGAAVLENWVNIDIWPAQLSLDLRRGLPFTDESVDRVYLSHTLEHFYYPHDVGKLLRDIHRVLAPGGRVRIVVPDIGAAIDAYVENDVRFFEGRRETSWPNWEMSTRLESFLGYSGVGPSPGNFGDAHKFGYDFETASHILTEAGFRNVTRSTYQGSADPALRVDNFSSYAGAQVEGRYYSLFVEAVR